MKSLHLSLPVVAASVFLFSALGARAQVSVNGTNEGATYNLGTPNQVAGANGSLSVGSGGTLTQSATDAIIGTPTLTFSGGTTTLSAANSDYAGTVTLTGGTLDAAASGALGSTSLVLYGSGTLDLSGTNALTGAGSISEPYQFQNDTINVTAPQNYSGTTTLAGWNTNGAALNVSGNGSLSNSTIVASGPYTTLNLETTNAISGGTLVMKGGVVNETAADAISGTAAVTVYSVDGNAVISGPNDYSGPTTIIGTGNPYSGGSNNEYGYISGTSLDFSKANSPVTNIINNGISHADISSGSSLVLSGAVLTVVGADNTANSQEFNGLTVDPGFSTLTADAGTGTSTASMTVALNGITREAGGAINFSSNVFAPANTGSTTFTTTTTNTDYTSVGGSDTIIGGWAVMNGSWAVSGATGGNTGTITALSDSSYAAYSTTSSINGADVEAGNQNQGQNSVVTTINSLRFSGGGSGDVAFSNATNFGNGTSTLTIASGGILVTNGSTNYIEGTTVNDGGQNAGAGGYITSGNGQDLIYTSQNNSSLELAANITDNGGTPIGLTVNGNGLSLWGDNTFTGQVTINSGTLILDSADALNNNNKLVFGIDGEPFTIAGGILSLNGNNASFSSVSNTQNYALNGGSMIIYNGNASSEATLSINNTTTDTFDGGISDNASGQSGSASLNFVKTGAGNLILTTAINNNNDPASLNYTGSTSISGGTVYLAASSGSSFLTSTSVITVGAGGGIGGNNATVGHAFTDGPASNATSEFQGLQIAGGTTAATRGTINLEDGGSSIFRIAQDAGATALYIGGTAGSPGAISLDVGQNTASNSQFNQYFQGGDEIALQYYASYYTSGGVRNSGNVYIAPGGFVVNLNGLGTLNGSPSYAPVTIMEVAGFDTSSTGFGGNTYGQGYSSFSQALSANAITLGTTTGNFNGYVVGLTSSSDANGSYLQLTETANPTPATAYFSGANGTSGNAWNTFTGGNANNSNWTTTDNGNTDTNQSPGSTTDVYFGTAPISGPALADYLNNTLAADTTINSLNFTSNSTGNVTIGGANFILTINNGLTDSGSGSETIATNVALGSSQTWTVNSTKPLTVSGNILDNGKGYGLTKTGAGTMIASGQNSYSGTTTISQGALLVTGVNAGGGAYSVDGGSLGGAGGYITSSGITLSSTSGSGLNVSGMGLGTVGSQFALVNPGKLTLNLGAGALDISKAGAGSLQFVLVSPGASDSVFLTSGALDIGSGALSLANFNFDVSNWGQDAGGTYVLFDTSSPAGIDGSLASSDLNGTLDGYDISLSQEFDNSGNADIVLTAVGTEAVPEPSTYALLLGGVALLALLRRRGSKQRGS